MIFLTLFHRRFRFISGCVRRFSASSQVEIRENVSFSAISLAFMEEFCPSGIVRNLTSVFL